MLCSAGRLAARRLPKFVHSRSKCQPTTAGSPANKVNMTGDPVSLQDIVNAHRRIAPYLNRTPVKTCPAVDEAVPGRKVYFKCENLQKTGSFKVRGALNAVLCLKERDPNTKGVVTHSSGNHALGLAYAAQLAGIPCSVVVPNNTPQVKCDHIRSLGADLVFCQPNPVSRAETCKKVSEERGQEIISSSDHLDVIAGQGTIALEFLEDVPDLDAILVAISGGGMTAGISLMAKHHQRPCKVFAVEPKGKDLEKCLRTGERLWPNPPQFVDTIAEGIRLQQTGFITFDIICQNAEKDVFTSTDEEMLEAMEFIYKNMDHMIIEASAGASVAAVMSDKMRQMDPGLRKVGVILCGGNVDVNKHAFFQAS